MIKKTGALLLCLLGWSVNHSLAACDHVDQQIQSQKGVAYAPFPASYEEIVRCEGEAQAVCHDQIADMIFAFDFQCIEFCVNIGCEANPEVKAVCGTSTSHNFEEEGYVRCSAMGAVIHSCQCVD